MPKGKPGSVMAARMSEEDMARFRDLVVRAVTRAGGVMRLGDLGSAVAELGGWSPQTDRRWAFTVAARRSLVEDGTLRVWRDLTERWHPEMVELASPPEQGDRPKRRLLWERVRAELVTRRGEYVGRRVDVLTAIVCEIVERETGRG